MFEFAELGETKKDGMDTRLHDKDIHPTSQITKAASLAVMWEISSMCRERLWIRKVGV